MAIIKFTEADKLATKIMEKGGYRAQISELTQKASSKQTSVNYWTTIKIVQEGPYLGKELEVCFNSETNAASILGTLQMFPARDLLRVKAAIENIKLDDVDVDNFDTDTIMNRDFDVVVGIATVEGNILNSVQNFLPAGSTQGKQPF